MARAASGTGVGLRPNNSLAATLGSLGSTSVGNAFGATLPLSCACAEHIRMAKRPKLERPSLERPGLGRRKPNSTGTSRVVMAGLYTRFEDACVLVTGGFRVP